MFVFMHLEKVDYPVEKREFANELKHGV